MGLLVGTSGWQYKDWRGTVYPADVPQRLWLEEYATRFSTVENNNAFYRLPDRETFESWRARTPENFVMAVKASRYLTHVKRLRDPAEPVARLLSRAEGLADRLGPVLLQLPPNYRADLDALTTCLRCFPPAIRVAVELRHPTWWDHERALRRLLERHGAALCWADRASHPVTPLWRTAAWGYVRFHEGRASPWPRYGPQALASWADRIRTAFSSSGDVYAYFNNDPGGAAVFDAEHFVRLAP